MPKASAKRIEADAPFFSLPELAKGAEKTVLERRRTMVRLARPLTCCKQGRGLAQKTILGNHFRLEARAEKNVFDDYVFVELGDVRNANFEAHSAAVVREFRSVEVVSEAEAKPFEFEADASDSRVTDAVASTEEDSEVFSFVEVDTKKCLQIELLGARHILVERHGAEQKFVA